METKFETLVRNLEALFTGWSFNDEEFEEILSIITPCVMVRGGNVGTKE